MNKGGIMLEKLKALRLKSHTREGQSRTDEQSRETEVQPTPEVRVLDFLKGHQDELITYKMIARGSKVQQHRVGGIIRELLGRGLVVRSQPSRNGTRYVVDPASVMHHFEDSNPSESTNSLTGSETDDIDFVKTTGDLVWSFIRATRSTDVLLYLTWLERQGGKDE